MWVSSDNRLRRGGHRHLKGLKGRCLKLGARFVESLYKGTWTVRSPQQEAQGYLKQGLCVWGFHVAWCWLYGGPLLIAPLTLAGQQLCGTALFEFSGCWVRWAAQLGQGYQVWGEQPMRRSTTQQVDCLALQLPGQGTWHLGHRASRIGFLILGFLCIGSFKKCVHHWGVYKVGFLTSQCRGLWKPVGDPGAVSGLRPTTSWLSLLVLKPQWSHVETPVPPWGWD